MRPPAGSTPHQRRLYCNGKRLGVFGKLANEINAELEIAKEQKDSQNIYLGELDYEALMSCVEGAAL